MISPAAFGATRPGSDNARIALSPILSQASRSTPPGNEAKSIIIVSEPPGAIRARVCESKS